MWKLKIAEGNGNPYLYSTNNFVGRQIWEYDPNCETTEEQEAIKRVCTEFRNNLKKGSYHACGDLLARMQLIRESGIDLLCIPPNRLGENEEVTFDVTTTAVKTALQFNCAFQAFDGHWPAELNKHVEPTASTLSSLVLLKALFPTHREKEIEISISKAANFLERRQQPDGSWYGFWGICFLYGTMFALSAAGKTYENSNAVRKALNFLLSTQNKEGGWGESYESCPKMKYITLQGNRTNLVQTSWAMLGLLYGGQVERDPMPLHSAAKLLINAQMDNGDFPQREMTGCFMKNCALHHPIYRNTFPLWALSEYRKRIWPTQTT